MGKRLDMIMLALGLKNRAYLRHDRREGWSGELPFFLALCRHHGFFVDYPHGYDEYLSCPDCTRQRIELVRAGL
jgi:hypothetical protein